MEERARNLCAYSTYMYVSACMYMYLYAHTDRHIYYFDISNITDIILCEAEILQIYES